MNDWKPKNASLLSHFPPSAVDRADARKIDVAQRFARQIEKLELRAGILLILREKFSVRRCRAFFKNRVDSGMISFQFSRLGLRCIHHEKCDSEAHLRW